MICPKLDENAPSPEIIAIRTLNDQLRVDDIGGMTVCTQGVFSLETDVIAAITDAIRGFDNFNPDNDPFGEHDCAMVHVGDLRIIFKIDYYDLTMMFHSDGATDPKITKRVMTIMLASEY